MNNIEELITALYDMIQDAWSVPLGGEKCVVEKDKILDLLDELRENMPTDIKMAKDIVAKRDEYLDIAKRESDAIKKQAEEYAKKTLDKQEILLKASKKADVIIKDAEKKSIEIKQAAGDFCDTRLRETEDSISKTLSELKESRATFKKLITKVR